MQNIEYQFKLEERRVLKLEKIIDQTNSSDSIIHKQQ